MRMSRLEPMPEHRTVNLFENVSAYLDCEIWPDAHDPRVERGMVQLAQGQPIANGGFSKFVTIRDDVCSVKQ
ncbi:hypothetical protein GCM10025788_07270 [Serinicoccus chungangensis]